MCIGRKNCESIEDLEAATDFMDDDKATQVLEELMGRAETDFVFSKIKSFVCFRPRLLDAFLVSVIKSLVIIVDVIINYISHSLGYDYLILYFDERY